MYYIPADILGHMVCYCQIFNSCFPVAVYVAVMAWLISYRQLPMLQILAARFAAKIFSIIHPTHIVIM